MSITVGDCLHIGILQDATVIAGAAGLNRPVECVSVIEFNGFQKKKLENVLTGNELSISAFSFLKDASIQEWCTFFSNAVHSGMACFVVFYVGTVIKEIPAEVLRMADEAAIPIILLPEHTPYAYSDLILPICEAILNDKRNASLDSTVFTDILNKILGLSQSQQNIRTLLSHLSQRTGYNLILTDVDFAPFAWTLPSLDVELSPFLDSVYHSIHETLPLRPQTILYSFAGQKCQIRFQPIHTNKLIGMLLVVQRPDVSISIDSSNQVAEIISMFLQLWRLSHGRLKELELRLDGDMQNVRPKKYQRLVVVGRRDGLPLKINDLQFSRLNYDTGFSADAYIEHAFFKGTIVLAGHGQQLDFPFLLTYTQKILSNIPGLCLAEMTLSERQTLQAVYRSISEAIPTAAVIFPAQNIFSAEEILFAEEINTLKKQLGSDLSSVTGILTPLRELQDWEKLFHTLAVTYLDCGGSSSAAAKQLEVHVNTVKYRVGRVRELLGLNLDLPVNYSRLILALAIERLLR